MKVLLINPPLTAKEQARDFEAAVNVLPPLGIAYIASVLEQDGFDVSIIDSLVMGATHSWIREFMEREKPEMVGIAATILQVESADLVAKNAKEISPNSVVVIGGPHVATMPERVVREGRYYDLGVTGEAEYTFREIARKIRSKDFNFAGVQGCYAKKKDGSISFGGVRPYIADLNELPFPARHLLPPLSVYTPSPITYRKFPVGTMMSSRGCPAQCTFCDRSVFGNWTRQRDYMNVVDEMQELVEVYGAKEIKFYDDTFTINQKRVIQICDEIKRRKLDVTWSCLTRVANVNKEILDAMHSAGCWHLLYGIENGNQHMLDYIKKGTNLDQIRKAVKWGKEAGINIRGSFICGLPGETKETIETTVKFALSLGLDEANFYTLALYPGNELYHMMKKEGKIRHENYEDYNPLAYDDGAVLAYVPDGMDEKELKQMIKRAHRRFYFRPTYVARQVMNIRSKEDINRYWHAARALFKLNYASG